jgi:hypothetical protein
MVRRRTFNILTELGPRALPALSLSPAQSHCCSADDWHRRWKTIVQAEKAQRITSIFARANREGKRDCFVEVIRGSTFGSRAAGDAAVAENRAGMVFLGQLQSQFCHFQSMRVAKWNGDLNGQGRSAREDLGLFIEGVVVNLLLRVKEVGLCQMTELCHVFLPIVS